ncbi:phage holin family protein [Sphingomonas sp. 1P06PA]|uniref:phage holin family protein n=1 Tax=Sphingomonas sp. 1P06PA TaxID=554121 RepID=UPI0039A55151
MTGAKPDDDAPLGTLFSRLLENAQRLLRAEIAVQIAGVQHRVESARVGIGLLAGAYLVAQAAVVMLLVGLVIGLGRFIGPVAAGFLVGIAGLVLAGIMAKIGLKQAFPPKAPVEVVEEAHAAVTQGGRL